MPVPGSGATPARSGHIALPQYPYQHQQLNNKNQGCQPLRDPPRIMSQGETSLGSRPARRVPRGGQKTLKGLLDSLG